MILTTSASGKRVAECHDLTHDVEGSFHTLRDTASRWLRLRLRLGVADFSTTK